MCESEWSKLFSIDAAGSGGNIKCKKDDQIYEVIISIRIKSQLGKLCDSDRTSSEIDTLRIESNRHILAVPDCSQQNKREISPTV